MLLELTNTLLVLGAAQGIFLAVLLFTKHTNHAANRVLAVAMVAFSIFVLQSLYYTKGYFREFPHLIGAPIALVFVFGPVLYVYAQTVSEGGHTFRKQALLHFLPAALVTLYFTPFYMKSGAEKVAYVESLMGGAAPLDLMVLQTLQYPHGITYVVLTILLLKRHRRKLRQSFSSIDRINLLWLRDLTVGIVIVWALATSQWLLALAGIRLGVVNDTLIPLAVSVLVYAIGYLALRQPEIFHRPPQHTPPDIEPAEESVGYERSGLTQEQAESHLKELLRLMEEKQLYRNSMLTLQDLADELSISQHHLSQVINTQLGKNFYDFVNGYRAEEVKRRLRDPKAEHLTILTIAFDAGFNTKSSFNAFFKKYTGLTPSQYRNQVQGEAA